MLAGIETTLLYGIVSLRVEDHLSSVIPLHRDQVCPIIMTVGPLLRLGLRESTGTKGSTDPLHLTP